jgi:hypothetical protein
MEKLIKSKLLLILLSIVVTNTINSQSISTEGIQYCVYDEATKSWKDCTTDAKHTSLMVINEQETIITHNTVDNKSVYYIEDKSNILNDEKEKVWVYNVVSDTGNKYIVKFNPTSRLIYCIYKIENETNETIFSIKTIF